MENQPKPLETYKNQHGTMKTNLEPSKLTRSCTGWLWGVQVVTGDSQEEVIIFRDTQTNTQTHHHNIHIIIIIKRRRTEGSKGGWIALLGKCD